MSSKLVFGLIAIAGGVGLWVTGVVYMFMALKNRKPNVPWSRLSLFMPDKLTEKGVKLLIRYYLAAAAFLAWLFLWVVIGRTFFP